MTNNTIKIDKLVILGLGLIGGSLALAARKADIVGEVVAWGRREHSLRVGLELGVIDSYSLDLSEVLVGASVVVVATPTQTAEAILTTVLAQVDETCIVTDVASVKGNLLAGVKSAFEKVPSNLVLAHPIAGSEQSGVTAAKDNLFVNHRVILTPTAETSAAAQTLIKKMWQATGADVVAMDVAKHDEVLAATSHLPHVLAYTLVGALAKKDNSSDVFECAAGGFRDFTRIAASDPDMWTEIALANKKALLDGMDNFSSALAELRSAIENSDGDSIRTNFEAAKKARDHFAKIQAERGNK
jgi:cyclohexadieny/prephenate dehydrogenase